MRKFLLISILLLVVCNFKLFSQVSGISMFNAVPGSAGKSNVADVKYPVNPARVSTNESHSIYLESAPSKFGMKELTPVMAFYRSKIVERVYIGGALAGLGNELYSEFGGAVVSALQLGEMFTFGVSLEANRIDIQNYGSDNIVKINLGGLIELSDYLTAGFAFLNANHGRYEGGGKTALQTGIFGFGIEAAEELCFDINGIIRMNRNTGFSIAGKYAFQDIGAVRIAYLTNPQTVEGGVNINTFDFLDIHASLQHHHRLGFSQYFGVSIFW